MSRLLWLLLVMITASTVLTGCGQRGPLYLPEDAEERDHNAR
ncbi:MAG: lipoprotein [Gammaproteobacteria bacterium]|nr:MAG: lipoprotein [Gammaproteobacteria bacterium]